MAFRRTCAWKPNRGKKSWVFLSSSGLESGQSTHIAWDQHGVSSASLWEINVTLEWQLCIQIICPQPHYQRGANNKFKNRKQHLIRCKLILWSFYITFAKNMHLFLLRCKKICLSVLLTNQINSLDNGLTVRTPFQILVNYMYNKIINSNKQNGFKPKPMRSSFPLATATHASSLCCCPKPKLQSARTCIPSCLWTPKWTPNRS